MIDLHSHTNASDGTDAPDRLIALALERDIEALAITDHDTFAGFDEASPAARAGGLDLICGVELSCKFEGKSPHLLAYFPHGPADAAFRAWVSGILESRRERNQQLIAQLRRLGVNIELADVEAVGRTVTGRPHFARVLIDRGYATDRQDAFDRLPRRERARLLSNGTGRRSKTRSRRSMRAAEFPRSRTPCVSACRAIRRRKRRSSTACTPSVSTRSKSGTAITNRLSSSDTETSQRAMECS